MIIIYPAKTILKNIYLDYKKVLIILQKYFTKLITKGFNIRWKLFLFFFNLDD